MDNEVSEILGDLCRAINDSLKGSQRISASVSRLEDLGYELALLLEATVVLSREDVSAKPKRLRARRKKALALSLSAQDEQYLKGLKIALATKVKAPQPEQRGAGRGSRTSRQQRPGDKKP